jgi:hypothetical protein
MDYELQNILSGTQQVSHGAIIQTISHYLRRCQETSALVKTDKHFKSEETKKLIHFIDIVFYIKDNRLPTKVNNYLEKCVSSLPSRGRFIGGCLTFARGLS